MIEPIIIEDFLGNLELKTTIDYYKKITNDAMHYDDARKRYIMNDPVSHTILVSKLELARKTFGSDTLLPTYAVYSRYVGPGSNLEKHKDDNACTYTLDLCLDQTTQWPIWVDNKEYVLESNQALAYYGNDQEHWRENLETNDTVSMIFLHYAEPDHWWFSDKEKRRKFTGRHNHHNANSDTKSKRPFSVGKRVLIKTDSEIMEKVYLDENIYVIKNFIHPDDIDKVLIDFKDSENWEKNGVFYLKSPDCYSDETKIILDKYKNKVEAVINDDHNIINWQNNLQKFVSIGGTGMEWSINPHADRFDYKKVETGESTSRYVTKGYILYFNNDFSGGEVVYVNKGITIRPEPGMLVVHSGFEEYLHGVKAVTSGERYMITGFVYERDFFENSMI